MTPRVDLHPFADLCVCPRCADTRAHRAAVQAESLARLDRDLALTASRAKARDGRFYTIERHAGGAMTFRREVHKVRGKAARAADKAQRRLLRRAAQRQAAA